MTSSDEVWTPEAEEALLLGARKHGTSLNDFKTMLQDDNFVILGKWSPISLMVKYSKLENERESKAAIRIPGLDFQIPKKSRNTKGSPMVGYEKVEASNSKGRNWTPEAEKTLLLGVEKYGNKLWNFRDMLEDAEFVILKKWSPRALQSKHSRLEKRVAVDEIDDKAAIGRIPGLGFQSRKKSRSAGFSPVVEDKKVFEAGNKLVQLSILQLIGSVQELTLEVQHARKEIEDIKIGQINLIKKIEDISVIHID